MKFFESTKRLAAEVFSFKKYKMMSLPLAIITGVFMLPLAVSFLFELGLLFILTIFYELVESPIRAIHKFMKDEAKEMSRVTEVVIYIVSWPAVFLLYGLYLFFALFIYFEYFFAQAIGYIVSLCGYRFHVSILEEDIAVEDKGHNYNVPAIIFIAVNGALLVGGVVLALFVDVSWASVFASVAELFTIVFTVIAFRNYDKEEAPKPKKLPKPKKEKKEEKPVEEEPKDEEKPEEKPEE